MTKRVRLEGAAKAELRDAARRYELAREGLGHQFTAAVRAALKLIGKRPHMWPAEPAREGLHRFVLKRFPFVIVYRELETDVHVLAVAHTSREPGYWSGRR